MDTQLSAEVEKLKEQGFQSICFWLPAYNVGGGTYVFSQMAIYLAEHTGLNIYFMDFKDGYATQVLEEFYAKHSKVDRVKVLEYREEDLAFPITEKCVVVTNSTRVIQLKRMNRKNRLLFWHYETVPCAWDIVLIQNEARLFLKLCRDENAMVFHDWSSLDAIMQDSGYEFPHSYLPIFLPPKQKCLPSGLKSKDAVNLVWLGRLGKEKIYSIYNIIANFSSYQTSKKKIMYIIGDGYFRKDVERFAEKYKQQIEFVFTGTIPKDRLDQYLLAHADIVFGMGTSALEGAALHIPSVVVKLDTKCIPGDEFWWLFDSREYCVGILPNQRKRFHILYSHFRDMMDDICEYGLKEEYGERCYQYYLENHSSFNAVVLGFLKNIVQCSLTMEKLEACIKYVPYNHVCLRRKKLLMWEFPPKVLFK